MSHSFYTHHAAERFMERYGRSTETIHWIEAFLDVVDGRSVLLARMNDGRERHLLRIAGVACRVVYDPDRALFITTLPS